VRGKGSEMRLNKQRIKQKECPRCGNKAFVRDSKGEVVCAQCGLVLEKDNISRQQEWRAFTPQEYAEKTRTEVLYQGRGTEIGYAFERQAPSPQIRRWKRHQRRATESKQTRNLIIAEQELQRIISRLYLPSKVKELATVIYKMALDQDLIRGRTITGMVSASIYFTCRLLQIPRPFSRFSEITRLSEKEIARNYRLLYKELTHKLDQKLNIKVQAPSYLQPINPITENLHISFKTAQLATKIIKAAEKKKLTQGRDPKGMAAAAIYIACVLNKEKRTQNEIADEAHVTEVTLRNRYKELKEKLLFEISL